MAIHASRLCGAAAVEQVALAEGMLNHLAAKAGKDVHAFSAGSAPSGRLNPFALEALTNAGVDVASYRSKSWDEFVGDDKPVMRVVITVCDSAALETCPYWPGSPVKMHWGYADPSNAAGGDEGKRVAFELRAKRSHIECFNCSRCRWRRTDSHFQDLS